jgi:hypothetical protein
MACTYNPSYLEDRDQEDHHWRPAQAEKLARLSPTSTNKSSIVVGTYNTWEDHGPRPPSGKNTSTIQKIAKAEKGLGVWLRGRVQGPELKLQYCQKKK